MGDSGMDSRINCECGGEGFGPELAAKAEKGSVQQSVALSAKIGVFIKVLEQRNVRQRAKVERNLNALDERNLIHSARQSPQTVGA